MIFTWKNIGVLIELKVVKILSGVRYEVVSVLEISEFLKSSSQFIRIASNEMKRLVEQERV